MNGKFIIGPAAVLVLVFFFLPWTIVSRNGNEVGEFSGFQLALNLDDDQGVELATGGEAQAPLFLTPFLAAFIGLILLAVSQWRRLNNVTVAGGYLGLALLGLLVLLLQWLRLRGEIGGAVEILIAPALWGTLLGLVGMGVGGVVELVRIRRGSYLGSSLGAYQPATSGASGPDYQVDYNHTILDDELIRGSSYDNATMLDDELLGGARDDNVTMLDDELAGEGGYDSNVTMLDEDLVDERSYGGATILDDSLVGGESYDDGATMLDESLTDDRDEPNYTILDEDLIEDDSGEGSFAWPMAPVTDTAGVVEGDARPESPPEPGTPKTEVLHLGSDSLASLVISNGDRKGEQFHLMADTTIGRASSNDIVLDETALSALHARIKMEDGRFVIYDENSTNGVYIFNDTYNRWERKNRCELESGSQIKLGRTVFHLVILG
jgi:hypothetical protein